eukprot:TRINITY_DN4815_c0_g1_i1.p1 TRINITY_DN4815_c0_g1~~TRINITY_DN4815_c0_g1_i1.p1  ORF type:complete len:153 (-),score=11.51 TRINITY_DN4815_c0_g1_i1:21-479(-)
MRMAVFLLYFFLFLFVSLLPELDVDVSFSPFISCSLRRLFLSSWFSLLFVFGGAFFLSSFLFSFSRLGFANLSALSSLPAWLRHQPGSWTCANSSVHFLSISSVTPHGGLPASTGCAMRDMEHGGRSPKNGVFLALLFLFVGARLIRREGRE